ncbi:MAG: hypothetical protein IPM58_11490 [Nitrospira sp.]|nr:hypothetical protein [Nitrospira sp.]
MLKNKDVIAQPSRGRFFPVTIAWTIKTLHDLKFAPPPYQKRLDIIFRNSDRTSAHGRVVAALHPPYEMVIYSVPEEMNQQHAKTVLDLAMRELAEFGTNATPYDRRCMSLSYRVYHSSESCLILAKRVRKGTQTKYRGDGKFSNAFKPKGIKTDELIIKSISLI